uniref:Armadillo repeat-containing protein 8 n=1 Tax=Syphacia muris TaxID=451379 RepID=A0A0N5API0_9BILA
MRINQESIQREAVQALNKFACYPHNVCSRITQAGGLDALSECARVCGGKTRDVAIQAIGNIAADCSACRREICCSGVVAVLINLLSDHLCMKQYSVENLLRTTAVVFENGTSMIDPQLTSKAIRCLYPLLFSTSDAVRRLATSCISQIVYGRFNEVQINLLLSVEGLLTRLLQLLEDPETSTSALLTIGRIVAGNDQQTQRVLDAGVIPRLVSLYKCHQRDKNRCRDIGWILSNLAAGNEVQIEHLFNCRHIVPIILELSRSDERSVRVEACWAASNAFHRASPRRVIWLCGAILPAIRTALDFDMGSALRENALKAVRTVLVQQPNYVYLLYRTNIMRRVRLIYAKETVNSEIRGVATHLIAAEDLMFSRTFLPSKFQLY